MIACARKRLAVSHPLGLVVVVISSRDHCRWNADLQSASHFAPAFPAGNKNLRPPKGKRRDVFRSDR